MEPVDCRIQPVDHRNASDREYALMNTFSDRIRAESRPDDPPIPHAERVAIWRNLPRIVEMEAWMACSGDGEMVASASGCYWNEVRENRHLVQMELAVLPDWRRRGLGCGLLERVVDLARREGRRLLVTNTSSQVPAGEEFMKFLGAQSALAAHENQLKLEDLNRELLPRWIDQAPREEYSLSQWEGPHPEERLEEVTELLQVMNSAPRGDLDMEDTHLTPGQVRELERSLFAGGAQRWTLVALERRTERMAGFTEVCWNRNRPDLLRQLDTGVLPEHRGKGIGRWLKAAMLEHLLSIHPEIDKVRTGNADRNAPMLKINLELGFKPHTMWRVWQIETDKALQVLRARSACGGTA